MDNIIVTGSTGYLGSNIVNMLVKRNKKVLCIKRENSSLTRLEDIKNHVEFINTSDKDFCGKIIDFNASVVVHTACSYDRNGISMNNIIESNLDFPLRLLEICSKSGIKNWINTGTSLSRNLNAYTLSKYQFSEWGEYYSKKNEINFCNILLEHFYGEKDDKSKFISFVIDKLKKNEELLLTDGLQKRDFIYIDDVVDTYLKLITLMPNGYTNIPLGTGVAPTIREVVEYLKEITDSNSKLRFGAIARREGEVEFSKADTSILNNMGCFCKVNWKDGMKKLYK